MADNLEILVVSDNLLARAGLASLLETQADCFIAGYATSDDLLNQLELIQPDVVLYDLGWRIADVVDTLSALARQDVPIVVLITDESDANEVMGAVSSFSVYGLLLNDSDPDMLQVALQATYTGLIVIDPSLAEVLTPTSSTTQDVLPEALTPRENDVLQLLAQGMTNKAIAHQLGITDHTVKFHVNAIMTKMGAQSRTEAVVIATRAGLIIL